MKGQYIYGAMILALLSATSSCSDEALFDATTSAQLHQVTINATSTIGDVGGNSRATLGGNEGVTPVWQDEDKIAVRIDNATETSKLTLFSGATTSGGEFTGTVTVGDNPQNMYFYYPASAATGVDLTTQDGSHTEEMVMFASAEYSTRPSIAFQNKTSILKFCIPVCPGSGWTESTNLTATVLGAYSKGKLDAKGNWSDLEYEVITVSNIKVKEGNITGYAVVIPGSPVTNLRIAITDGTDCYITNVYTNDDATIPENTVITISREAVAKALVWTSSITDEQIIKYIVSTFGFLTIANQMNAEDFSRLSKNINSMKTKVFLTLLDQESLPDGHYFIKLFRDDYLTSVSAPNVTTIESCAFDCYSLTSVFFPKATTIGEQAFTGCSSLTSVSLPKATTIGFQAFAGCISLGTISLPLATSVGEGAFYGCKSLTSVSLPQAESVGVSAFECCNSLTTISLPKATTVGDRAFYDCESLTTISLPKATTVGDQAFYLCKSLSTLILPLVESVGDNAFYNDYWKEEITLIVSPDATWYGDESLWRKVYKGKYIEWTPGTTQAADVTSTLGEGTDLIINAKSEMKGADFEELKSALSSKGEGTINLTLLNQESLRALKECTALKSVTAPHTIEVRNYAFDGCTSLTTVSLPQATIVGEGAFYGCSSLTTVSLPQATDVYEDAFYGCTSLTTVSLPQATDVYEDAFKDCTTKNITLTVKAGSTWWKTYGTWKSVTET